MELSEGEAGSYTHLGRYLSSRSIMSSMDLSTQPRARMSAPHSSNMRRTVHAPASAKGLGSRLIAFQRHLRVTQPEEIAHVTAHFFRR